ncbi:MAG: DUF4252 domain-containing protein [Tannerellaceae bacterium]|nr:DUF4252 domain-containing protein [Tannerellaceae bacterium]
MKTKYILLSICILFSSVCFGQKKLFDKYADEDHVTSVYISKAMFDMIFPSVQTAGLNLMNMTGKIEGLQILTTNNKDQAENMRKDFKGIAGKEHEELMRVKDGKTKANFYIQKKGDKISEMLMLADTDDGFTIIQLLGKFTLQDIQDVISEVD